MWLRLQHHPSVARSPSRCVPLLSQRMPILPCRFCGHGCEPIAWLLALHSLPDPEVACAAWHQDIMALFLLACLKSQPCHEGPSTSYLMASAYGLPSLHCVPCATPQLAGGNSTGCIC